MNPHISASSGVQRYEIKPQHTKKLYRKSFYLYTIWYLYILLTGRAYGNAAASGQGDGSDQ
jgi:hypothetical protein